MNAGGGLSWGRAGASTDEAEQRASTVITWLEDLIAGLPVPSSHRDLLQVHLAEARAQLLDDPRRPAFQLPLLVHGAVSGEEEPALPLAGACLAVYLGADVLDNIADGELPECWRGWEPSQVSLAGATYLSTLPHVALSRLEGSVPERTRSELSRVFADALLTMSAGQHQDLVLSGRPDVTVGNARQVAESKSGAEVAVFTRAAAVLAGADEDVVEGYATYGRCLGAGGQIASDLSDIWSAEAPSRDLANGKRTIPVVHALTTLDEPERRCLLAALDEARVSVSVHDVVRRVLVAAGSLQYTALVVEAYRQRALATLEDVRPREPYAASLRAFASVASLLHGYTRREDACTGGGKGEARER